MCTKQAEVFLKSVLKVAQHKCFKCVKHQWGVGGVCVCVCVCVWVCVQSVCMHVFNAVELLCAFIAVHLLARTDLYE